MIVSAASKIKDVLTFQPDVFYDHRGENVQTFYDREVKENLKRFGLPELDFPVDSFSFSKKNVLRGFHGDKYTWKLVQCLQGEIQLVIIDLREGSQTLKVADTFFLNDKNRTQVLIPSGCVNAHLCLSDTCIFAYKLSNSYVPQDEQIHLRWDVLDYDFRWANNGSPVILSRRDS